MNESINLSLENLLSRAAKEVWDGCYVNLGLGLPCKILPYINKDIKPFIHSENGLIGSEALKYGEAIDSSCIDAGGAYVNVRSGGSFVDSGVSFAMIRKSRIDLCMLGAFEVDEMGNLANWKIPGKFTPGIGGAVELAQKSKRLVVLTTCLDKFGKSKLKKLCSLPLTAPSCVDRIITDLGVIDCTEKGFVIRELFHGVTFEEMESQVDTKIIYEPL